MALLAFTVPLQNPISCWYRILKGSVIDAVAFAVLFRGIYSNYLIPLFNFPICLSLGLPILAYPPDYCLCNFYIAWDAAKPDEKKKRLKKTAINKPALRLVKWKKKTEGDRDNMIKQKRRRGYQLGNPFFRVFHPFLDYYFPKPPH